MSARRRLPLVLALAVATSLSTAAPALATADVATYRLFGADRYETAAEIAYDTFGFASTAVIGSGTVFADALSASYLAGRLDAPILLTAPRALSGATERALADLEVDGVVIVGGTVAVSKAVEDRLRALGYEVERVAGADRYETSRRIAESFPKEVVSDFPGTDLETAMVASGAGFADALAGAPVAYSESFPVLLTPQAGLSPQARAALLSLEIKQVFLLGGPLAVSPAAETAIRALGIRVERLAGETRAETAVKIADFEVDRLAWPSDHVNLARGDAFADALAGSPHEGAEQGPLLLTNGPGILGPATRTWLQQRSATVSSIDVLGGTAAVSAATLDEARRAATTP